MSNKALIYRWFDEVWNQGKEATIHELLDEDSLPLDLMHTDAEGLRGPDAFKPFFTMVRSAFPDLQITVEDVIEEGDKVVARCRVRGTHTGEGLGISPTGRPISINGMSMARVRDGKMIETWNSYDMLSLFQQIGALPSPAVPITVKSDL